VTWFALYAPAGLPKSVMARLVPQIAKTMDSAEVKERLATVGVEPASSTPEQLKKRQAGETAIWRDVITRAKITLEE
jgi:tripartite-type tricarboxylate transporter receptor subunit TctC